MATATKNSRAHEVEDEEGGDDDLPSGLHMHYEEDEETGRITVVIEGRAEVEITEGIDPTTNEPRFYSTAYNKPQAELKQAIEWVGRNTVTRAARAAWNEKHPNEPARATGTSATAQLKNEMAAMKAMLDRLIKAQGVPEPGSKG